MMIDEALYTHLVGNSPLAALVGDRVYPDIRPQNGPLPAVTYQWISTAPTTSRDGGGELRLTRFQFDAFAADALARSRLAIVLEAALLAFKRPSGPRVDVVFLDNRSQIYESETMIYRASVDALVQYYEDFT